MDQNRDCLSPSYASSNAHLGNEWWDLCAGPHVETTRKINKKADEAGGGLVFWHPKGAIVRNIIEESRKKMHVEHVAKADLWSLGLVQREYELAEWENWAKIQLMSVGSDLFGKFSKFLSLIHFHVVAYSMVKISSISGRLFRLGLGDGDKAQDDILGNQGAQKTRASLRRKSVTITSGATSNTNNNPSAARVEDPRDLDEHMEDDGRPPESGSSPSRDNQVVEGFTEVRRSGRRSAGKGAEVVFVAGGSAEKRVEKNVAKVRGSGHELMEISNSFCGLEVEVVEQDTRRPEKVGVDKKENEGAQMGLVSREGSVEQTGKSGEGKGIRGSETERRTGGTKAMKGGGSKGKGIRSSVSTRGLVFGPLKGEVAGMSSVVEVG
ncbi:predicted protein [Arabidopsis lyrata subsp. lyrata]|uniref:Predicted protein n=1 Tax=Arabidopsis lyrata subsp. lyrata TaxID=81972 RepID=D7MVK5_ARALL|nr:predicted protein [Arabidopsis lyrata subsp. lyrata]